jgi:RNA polymerase sigma factor (sigma-70 family)
MNAGFSVAVESCESLDALVVAAQAGCEKALDLLIEALSASLWDEFRAQRNGFAVSASRGRSDLIQDTLVTAREHFGRFDRLSFTAFRRWARTILRNRRLECARNHRCRNNRPLYEKLWRNICQRVEAAPHRATPDDALEWKQNVARIAELYELLRVDERFIIKLRLFKTLSYPQIAALTGFAPDAIRKSYDRAIARLGDRFFADGKPTA